MNQRIFHFNANEEPDPEALKAWEDFCKKVHKHVWYGFSDLERGLFIAGFTCGKEKRKDE